MGQSLSEYAALHPQQEPEQEREQMHSTAREIESRRQERERVAQVQEETERLKARILQQLEAGNAPEIVLYTAIRTIGLLSSDPGFAEAGQHFLDAVYADLEQQTIDTDNAAVAAARLEAMQREYRQKLKNSLTRQIQGYRRVRKALDEALEAVGQLEPPDADE